MARIYEYQGKQILKTVGVPIPQGEVASSPQEARKIAEWIGGFAETPGDAERASENLLKSKIKGPKRRTSLGNPGL